MFEDLAQLDQARQARKRASSLFRALFDPTFGDSRRFIARGPFLRALALIYFSAFFSLLFQIPGRIISPDSRPLRP